VCLADVGTVIALDDTAGTASVQVGERVVDVSLAPLVLSGASAEVGDWLVVHTGLAVELLDPDEAARIRDARAELHAPEGGTGQ
jgi:hydrogenase assembly chaperone HypC/HupF